MTPYHPLFAQFFALASVVGPGALLFLERTGLNSQKIASCKGAFVNQAGLHAELIATYKRAQADAAHKSGLIRLVATKGPKAIEAAITAANKAAKRRDSYAKKLAEFGVNLED